MFHLLTHAWRAMAFSLIAAASFMATAASAEVVKTNENGFVVRHTVEVETDAKQVWLALISPAKWWDSKHSWSGDSANLKLRPQAGGCFCERIPEDPDADRITLEGSVEHMRVIQSYPEKVLRMRGGLGPLQSEPASGILTIAIGEGDNEGSTKIVWEYVVGGYMRYKIPVIAKAVDGVLSLQSKSLADLLGPVDGNSTEVPDDAADIPKEGTSDEADPVDDDTDDGNKDSVSDKDVPQTLEEAIDALADG